MGVQTASTGQCVHFPETSYGKSRSYSVQEVAISGHAVGGGASQPEVFQGTGAAPQGAFTNSPSQPHKVVSAAHASVGSKQESGGRSHPGFVHDGVDPGGHPPSSNSERVSVAASAIEASLSESATLASPTLGATFPPHADRNGHASQIQRISDHTASFG
jgi:hypothetical protein